MGPAVLVAAMATATSRIGLAATFSTTFIPPYHLARLVSSLDHLSRGRIGWNVVTSVHGAENYGMDSMPSHDDRYDQADEYLAVCRSLWTGWEPDAVVLDCERDMYADPAKVHESNFDGKYYKVRGPLKLDASPQGQPVVIMAGSSPRGQRFCAEHAEVTIAHKNTVEDMKVFTEQVRTALSDAGRDPHSCKVFVAVKPTIGETESIAEERLEFRRSSAKLGDGLAYLSQTMGIDVTKFDLDAPLPADLAIDGVQGKIAQHRSAAHSPTVREMAIREARFETFEMWGTPATIADQLEATRDTSDIDGFHIRAGFTDYLYMTEFLGTVVPELQRRGLFRTEYQGTTMRDHLFEQ